ncbi:MAG TPA: cellulose biosynthesis protein BcsS [Beijerinckiaceae bacterium]
MVTALLLALLPRVAAKAQSDNPRDLNTVLFGSLDGGRSVFMSAGVKRTLSGSLDRDGFLVMGGTGFGGAPEHGMSFGIDFRPTMQAYGLVGYQWMFPRVAVSALVGPELDAEADGLNVIRSARTRFGLRGHAELWAHPTPETLATATLIAGSARGHVWSRISGGYAFWPGVFLGPEAVFYTRDDYREWRFGAHVTGLKWGPINFRFSGGLMRSNGDRTGAYFGLSGYVRM